MRKKTLFSRYEAVDDFDELQQIYRCVELIEKDKLGKIFIHGEVECNNAKLPIISLYFGEVDRTLPTLVLCSGIHGLERVTAHVVTAWLWSVIHLLKWNSVFRENMTKCRLLVYPLANPGGMFLGMRSNPNGVDLMRNAPIEADGNRIPLVCGHRITPDLPWYRGKSGDQMELESVLLVDFVKRECFNSKLCISIDVHSGFGTMDRIWFPFAGSKKLFPDAAFIYSLKQIMDQTYPSHPYNIEPQSLNYTAHGDLWDFLYTEYKAQQKSGLFIPLSLELGSWLWAWENPKQLKSRLGIYNPMMPHRLRRTTRRHILLFDFLLRAVQSPDWTYLSDTEIALRTRLSEELWY